MANTLTLGLEVIGAKKAAAQVERLFRLMTITQKKFTKAQGMQKWAVAFKAATAVAAASAAVFVAGMTMLIKAAIDGIKAFAKFDAAASKLRATLESFNAKGQGIDYGEYTAIADRMAKSTALARTELAEGASLIALLGTNAQVFEAAMNAAADYATATGTQLKHAARWMQTVLEAPTKGIDKLRRAGIHISKQMQQQLALMEKRGQLDEARLLVLSQFEKYEQAAEAYAKSTAGLWDRAKRSWTLMQSEFGEGIMNASTESLQEFVEMMEEMNEAFDMKQLGADTVDFIGNLGQGAIKLYEWVDNLIKINPLMQAMLEPARIMYDLLFDTSNVLKKMWNRLIDISETMYAILKGWGNDPIDAPNFDKWKYEVGNAIEEGAEQAAPEIQTIMSLGWSQNEAGSIAKRLAELNQTADAYYRKTEDLAREEEYLTYLRETETSETRNLVMAQEKVVQGLSNYVDNVENVNDVHSRLQHELVKQAQAIENAKFEELTKRLEDFGKTIDNLASPAEKASKDLENFIEVFEIKMAEAIKTTENGINVTLDDNTPDEVDKLIEGFEKYRESIKVSLGVYSEAELSQKKYNNAVAAARVYMERGIITTNEAIGAMNAANKVREDELGITAKRQAAEKAWKTRRENIYDMANDTTPFSGLRESIAEVVSFMKDNRSSARDMNQGEIVLADLMSQINEKQGELLENNKQQLEFSRVSDPAAVYDAIQDSFTRKDDPTTKAVREQTKLELRALKELKESIENRTVPAIAAP